MRTRLSKFPAPPPGFMTVVYATIRDDTTDHRNGWSGIDDLEESIQDGFSLLAKRQLLKTQIEGTLQAIEADGGRFVTLHKEWDYSGQDGFKVINVIAHVKATKDGLRKQRASETRAAKKIIDTAFIDITRAVSSAKGDLEENFDNNEKDVSSYMQKLISRTRKWLDAIEV